MLLVAAVWTAVGCGYIGEPLPPLANVPARVGDLTAVQRGAVILARFTPPPITTENQPIKTPLELDLRVGPRAEGMNDEAWAAAAVQVKPSAIENGVARYEIPISNWAGKEVLLRARSRGSNGKESAWSNFFAVPVAQPLETPANLRGEAVPEGVRLSWQARAPMIRIFRRTGTGSYTEVAETPQPPWTDGTVQFGQPYTYRVQSFASVREGLQAESEFSAEFSIQPEDKFPPAAPVGLQANDTPATIQLTWEARSEPDLAGYRVYRSVGQGPPEKVAEVTVPAYSDRNVEMGKAYRYTVTAFDGSGNESLPSAPAEARLQ
jgi:hypothetical protein